MLWKSANIYYGYKMKEYHIRQLFEADYRNTLECKHIKKKIGSKSIDEYIHNMLKKYVNNRLNQKKYKYNIQCDFLRCCSHEINSDWIIGIKITHIKENLSDINIEPLTTIQVNELPFLIKSPDDIEKYAICLQKMLVEFGLHIICNKEPQFYSIADYCFNCT